jgi:hypothetical protein
VAEFRRASGETGGVGRELGERGGRRRLLGARRLPATQDSGVHGTQFGSGIGAEAVGEPLPDHGVPIECFRVAARGVQRAHEQRFQRFGQRVLVDEVGNPGEHGGGVAEPEFQVGPLHHGVEPPPVPGRADVVGPVARDRGQRRSPPEPHRLRQRRDSVDIGFPGVLAAFDEAGEPEEVDHVRIHVQDIAGTSA